MRDDERLYHAIKILGWTQVFQWVPNSPLEQMWTCGLYRCSPGVMAVHEYMGVASVIYTTDVRQDSFGKKRRW